MRSVTNIRLCARRGFTLIEMIVVIAILLLLMGILIPVLSRARAEGRRVACKSNLSQLAKAIQMYVTDHQSTYPTLASRPTINNGMTSLKKLLMPYIKDDRLLRCPEDRQALFETEGASYEWNAALNGRTQDGPIEQILGPSKTPMMYDYENFHADPGPGGWGGKNVVFMDGSVSH
jgi:prepilin-type N-terminal cleavage/methylation domain-containing protein